MPILTPEDSWRLLLALADARRAGDFPTGEFAVQHNVRTARIDWLPASAEGLAAFASSSGWSLAPTLPADTRALLDLYLPLVAPLGESVRVIAQLGQSIDGQIATGDGDSYYVTGAESLVHLHRLRALCDAVIVGANTVAIDNPRLTTRRAPGPSPVRVVLDASARLDRTRAQVFTDGAARTLVVHQPDANAPDTADPDTLNVAVRSNGLDLHDLLRQLGALGLRTILVEGGGMTISRFLEAGLLDRLHIAVAPLIIGSGRPGILLPPIARLSEALRPAHRVFQLGADILWDFDLRKTAPITTE
ncbi:MAG: RibD family protein [Thiotrichales bacterium]